MGYDPFAVNLNAIVNAYGGGQSPDAYVWAAVLPGIYAPTTAGFAVGSLISQGGTAQAGSLTTITLANPASAQDGFYAGQNIHIVAGTGAGEESKITAYVGATRVATVNPPWPVAPDNTSVYAVQAEESQVTVGGYAAGQDPATLILAAAADGTINVGKLLQVLTAFFSGIDRDTDNGDGTN